MGVIALYLEVLQRRRLRCTALMHVLARFSSWSVSTSGLEQRFSKAAASIPTTARGTLKEQTESNIFVLITNKLDVVMEDALCAGARAIWGMVYETCRRNRTGRRLDIGLTHKWKSKKSSSSGMKGFLRRRRAALGDIDPGSGGVAIDAYTQRETSAALPAKMCKELVFLQQKQYKRKVEALHELLPEETDATLLEDAEDNERKKAKSRQQRGDADQRKRSRVNKKPFDINKELLGQVVPNGCHEFGLLLICA